MMEDFPVHPPKPDALSAIFAVPKPIIGMVHLPALPGAPRYAGASMRELAGLALADARAWQAGGADGLIVENGGDLPFARPEDIGPETVASMAVLAAEVAQAVPLPLGINCLANAGIPALAIAQACGACFVRVNQWVNAYVANEGLIEGQAPRVLRYRSHIRAEGISIFADVHAKHGSHAIVADRSLAEQTRDAVFFDADVLIATGQRTGDPTPVSEVEGIRSHSDGLPVIVGSGLRDDNAAVVLASADGAIVGTWAKRESQWWQPVDARRVERLMGIVRRLRG